MYVNDLPESELLNISLHRDTRLNCTKTDASYLGTLEYTLAMQLARQGNAIG